MLEGKEMVFVIIAPVPYQIASCHHTLTFHDLLPGNALSLPPEDRFVLECASLSDLMHEQSCYGHSTVDVRPESTCGI